MSDVACRITKPRCGKGRFVSSGSSRSSESLAKQKLRQKAYIARKTRKRKLFINSFSKVFIIKTQERDHWLPGRLDGGPLFKWMDEIIDGRYLESPRLRLKALKNIYFRGNPSLEGSRLPRIRAWNADEPDTVVDKMAAFVCWRFSCPTNIVEMDAVKKWLNSNEKILKVTVRDSMDSCFRIFSSYKKQTKKYMYCGYPTASGRIEPDPIPPRIPNGPAIEQVTEDQVAGPTAEVSDPQPEEGGQETVTAEMPQADKLKYEEEIMKVAMQDVFYKSLKVALAPSCPIRFDILCTVWMSVFLDGKPTADWCGLHKEIFEYCRLKARGEANTRRSRQLEQQLNDDFEVFRMVRRSAGLPLYDDDS